MTALREPGATAPDMAPAVALLISGPTVIALVSAAASVAMSARRRREDAVLLERASASRVIVAGTTVIEMLLHVGTATISVAVLLALVGGVESWLLERWVLTEVPIFLVVIPFASAVLLTITALAADSSLRSHLHVQN